MLVASQDLSVIVLHVENITNLFLSIWKAIFKQFNFTVNHKSSGKMESVTVDVDVWFSSNNSSVIFDAFSASVQYQDSGTFRKNAG